MSHPPCKTTHCAYKVSVLLLALSVSTHAQQLLAQTGEEEIVRLSPFAVNESANVGRYQAVESTSGSRVRLNLMDSAQSVTVITNEFMNDIGVARLLDATRYVAGISETTQSSYMDTMSIRGFASQGSTLDGFRQFNWSNQDPIVIERTEVVKGPNAILAPQGTPGGGVNNITKKPLFTNRGSLSYQAGRWDSNRAEFDANYVVSPDKLAVRIVAAGTDADDYGKGAFHQNITVMPMLTYRLSPTTQFTLQFHASNAWAFVNVGNPLSIYALGRENLHLLEGLPRNFQLQGRLNSGHHNAQNTRFFLDSQITDKLSFRVAGSWVESEYTGHFVSRTNAFVGQTGLLGEVVVLDHTTGEWGWDGVTTNPTPTYQLGGQAEWQSRQWGIFQNDFVYEHLTSTWKSNTVAGYTFNYGGAHTRQKNYVSDGIYYSFKGDYTSPYYTLPDGWTANASTRTRSNQIYIYEVLALFDNRLILSGSLSQNRYVSIRRNNRTATQTDNKAEALLPSGGFVYKLTPEISVFYGYSKQSILMSGIIAQGVPPHTRPSRQHEVGVRVRLLDGRLYATLSYFDILQENVWALNPRNYELPRPSPLAPALNGSKTSKGVEFELAWSPTENLSLIASVSEMKLRDSDNMREPLIADQTAAIWGSYIFTEGPLRGLRVGLGANYVGERAGDGTGWTQPPPGYSSVRIQPSFWMPSYVVAQASASYRFNKHWWAQLTVNNLFDKDYIPGSFNRNIYVSTPINPKLTVRYEF